jgi:2-amino-4-hydroxy-6-hydroxymethyldihydropteridine diphosphokinase
MLPPWACVSPKRLEHIRRVAALAGDWADQLAVAPAERERWLRAVWLHDALRDAPEAELARWAPEAGGPIELRHGPAAAARAAATGETDSGVLLAVRFHSLGHPDWDMVGRVLYCADYLEPGRRFDAADRGPLARRFPDDPAAVLREVARRRLLHVVRSGWVIPEPSSRFWNVLVSPAGSR